MGKLDSLFQFLAPIIFGFLLSLVEMRQAQNMLTSFRQPITTEDYPSLPISMR